MEPQDLTGRKFGRLTVLEKAKKDGRTVWKCLCECGRKATPTTYSLNNGASRSCGCQIKVAHDRMIAQATQKRPRAVGLISQS
jgi:hypothetical protein